MNFNIRSVFESECEDLKFDAYLAKAVKKFAVGFVNKNEEHMAFFGGHTTGVQVVRFTPADRDEWFSIFKINDWSLEEKLLDLPTVNRNFVVSSDVFNQTCMWLVHKFLTTPLLSQAAKREAAIDCALVLHYRFLTSHLSHYFKHYLADPEIAESAYAMLSNKYSLKQYGSWKATLEARCEDLVSDSNIHHKTLIDYEPDVSIIYLIGDTQGRLRDMFKNIFAMIVKAENENIRISRTSHVIELDGESMLRDKNKSLAAYIRYLASIASDQSSFIKKELEDVVVSIQPTMPPKLLTQTLEWCSKNFQNVGAPEVQKLFEMVLVHSFEYLSDNRTVLTHHTDLAGLVSRLRGVYMASRSSDARLLELRDMAQGIVRKATSTRNDSVISSVRTGVLLYLVLRAYTMKHYSS